MRTRAWPLRGGGRGGTPNCRENGVMRTRAWPLRGERDGSNIEWRDEDQGVAIKGVGGREGGTCKRVGRVTTTTTTKSFHDDSLEE